ncbi:MAG: hypothetical protein OEZ59_12120, partial [Deltaproteobacteria bacterium]|nr:hypothetical protein [Deltaproteobacteria bacterium]
MGEITREDLKIILAFALHVAKVDHEFANMEKVIIKRFVEVSHIEQEELAQLASTRISLADCLGRMSGDEAKSLLVQTMCAVAHCDGVTKDVESEFIN